VKGTTWQRLIVVADFFNLARRKVNPVNVEVGERVRKKFQAAGQKLTILRILLLMVRFCQLAQKTPNK
jgi:hypothetical protein